MPVDAEHQDPLQRAVVELRLELNRLIDEQVAYLKERTEEIAPTRPSRSLFSSPPPPPPSPPDPPPSKDVAEPPAEVGMAPPLDPRQRLDALAKHLDNRRRLANVPAPERGPSAVE